MSGDAEALRQALRAAEDFRTQRDYYKSQVDQWIGAESKRGAEAADIRARLAVDQRLRQLEGERDGAQALLRSEQHRADRAEARCGLMREALEPFAKTITDVDVERISKWDSIESARVPINPLVTDLLRARSILADHGGKSEEPRIERRPDVLNGEAVFHGTRLSVMHVGKMAEDGEAIANILADYPYLTEPSVEFARCYYLARSRGKSDQGEIVVPPEFDLTVDEYRKYLAAFGDQPASMGDIRAVQINAAAVAKQLEQGKNVERLAPVAAAFLRKLVAADSYDAARGAAALTDAIELLTEQYVLLKEDGSVVMDAGWQRRRKEFIAKHRAGT